jgi:5-keto-L-gluconate epimerase
MKLAVPVAPRKRKFAPIPFQGPVDEVLPMVRESGFAGIELNIRHPDEVDESSLRDLLQRHVLDLVAVTTGAAYFEEGLCLSDADAARRAEAVTRIADHCVFASRFDAMVVVGIMRGRLDDDADEARRQHERFTTSLRQCADIAGEHGVTLIVEPINRFETNYLPTTEATMALLDEVARPNIRLLLDTFHMNIEERCIEAAFAAAAGRIGLVQVVDSNRRAPGQGHVNFRTCLAVLEASGYDGYLSAEVLPIPDGITAARQTCAHLQPYLR